MSDSYSFTYQGGSGEIVEKKSRFIATVAPVKSEEEAVSFIEQIKKQYWDARHNCSAFTVGNRHQLTRCSDDGEPAGTAGRPMLDVLLGGDIHDTAVVVTRYFGGTLLGTGGLVRAYSAAVREGLNNSVILKREPGVRLTIETDYSDLGKIQYLLAGNGIFTLDSSYTELVRLETLVPAELLETILSAVTEGTGGRAILTKGAPLSYAVHNSQVLILDEEVSP